MSEFRCLALETSVPTSTVAACKGEHEKEMMLPAGRKAAAALFETIDEVLSAVDLTLEDLDCIAFGRGPGNFTGLRVATAAAQGLALGTGLRLCGVSSLGAMAQDAWERGRSALNPGSEAAPGLGGLGSLGGLGQGEHSLPPETEWFAPCLPAGRDQVYMGWYRAGKTGLVSAQAEDWLATAEACCVPVGENFVAAGESWKKYSTLYTRHEQRIVAVMEGAMPRARTVLRLALREYADGHLIAPEDARPVYLRSAV